MMKEVWFGVSSLFWVKEGQSCGVAPSLLKLADPGAWCCLAKKFTGEGIWVFDTP